MNVDPEALRILCYGDSNTWGFIPGSPGNGERFSVQTRWTGILQKNLGEGFEVIEEGLNGRTTVLEDPQNEGKNGKEYLKSCLRSHSSLDLVVLMLGTNDLKERYQRTAKQIAEGIEELVKIIFDPEYNYNSKPQILLLSPPLVDESVPGVETKYLQAGEKSKQLADLYGLVARKYSIEFLNIAKIVRPSKVDGYHLDEQSHKELAEKLTKKIGEIFSKK